jgi:hypothetical protein
MDGSATVKPAGGIVPEEKTSASTSRNVSVFWLLQNRSIARR